jgi:hypothetical protein
MQRDQASGPPPATTAALQTSQVPDRADVDEINPQQEGCLRVSLQASAVIIGVLYDVISLRHFLS